jgi:glycosyltransferase involved in cell wall biosynthesis
VKPRALFLDHVGALGGAELALMDLALPFRDTSTFLLFADGPLRERLLAAGARVSVLEGGAALHRVRRESGWPGFGAALRVLSLAWRVSRVARKHDLIHANSQKAFIVACLAGFLARRPVVWALHDVLSPAHFSRTNIRLGVGLANRCAERVIANSRASATALIAEGGRTEKVRVVYNGIDAAPFDAVTGPEIEAARRELGLSGMPVAGVFGRLAPWKGQHVAIEALTRVPGVGLLLVGNALFGEEAYAASLRQRAAELGVADRVRFAGFRSDIPVLMRLCDVVLHTSTAPEPFGRVIVEGMLAGRPVVATRGGGVDEIVDDGVTGVLVTPGDPDRLAGAVGDLLRDPARAARLAEAGRSMAMRSFTVAAMVSGVTAALEEVAAK